MSAELAPLPPADLEQLLEKAARYMRATRTPSTLRRYSFAWRAFVAWCGARDLEPLPADPRSVALYLADQAGRIKPAGLEVALSAIAAAHEGAGYPSPRSDPTVRKMRQGIRNSHPIAQASKAPLGAEQLRAILEALPSSPAGARDRALLVIGWLGALRRSEIVALDLADVREVPAGLEVELRRSKTDQEGKGRRVALPRGRGGICPVVAWRAWLEVRGTDEGPAFVGVRRHGGLTGKRLHGSSIARLVQRLAGRGNFAGHSLRAGFVTSAALAGRSERSIQAQTGHKDAAMVRRYVRLATLFLDNAAEGLL